MAGKKYLSLRKRVNRIIIVSLILGMGLLTGWFGWTLYTAVDNATTENLTQQSDFLYQAIQDFMLPGEAPLAVDFFRNISELDPSVTIALYRADGTTAFSDERTIREVNNRIGRAIFPVPEERLEPMEPLMASEAGLALGPPPGTHLFRVSKDSRLVQRVYKPLLNLPDCTGCHGAEHTVRGLLDLRIDITDIRNRQITTLAVTAALFLLLLGLLILTLSRALQRRVLQPISRIGEVCRSVTEADFTHRVDVSNRDEIGDLAERVNTMVEGLKERFQLTKYVSSSTIQALKGDEEGKKVVLTLLFSDIRGFTSFSEQNEPHTIVETLNHILSLQTDIIHHYQGDIDKYVGDEIVALFTGNRHELRASRAALEIQKQLTQCADKACRLRVGIGINTGEVILGRMGSDQRADFTVIGDSVNTAARLCSAAGPGEILTAPSTVAAIRERAVLHQPQELTLKGKAETISVRTLVGLKAAD